MAPGRSSRRLPRSGIGIRLAALVVVPLAALTTLAGVVLSDTRAAARQASSVEELAPLTSRLARLVHAVQVEQASAQVVLQSPLLGYEPDLAFDLLGPAFVPGNARAATDDLAAEVVAAGVVLPASFGELAELRRAVGEGTISGLEADHRYLAIGEELHRRLTTTVRDLQSRAFGIRDGERVARSLGGLVALVDALTARGTQFISVAPLYFENAGRDRARAALARATEGLERAIAELAAYHPELAAAWAAVERDADISIIDDVATLIDEGQDPTLVLTVDDLFEVGEAGSRFQFAASQLVGDAGLIAEGDATELQWAAEGRFRAAAAGVVGAFVVTLALCVWIGRSISTPLLRLQASAAAIRDGILDVPSLPSRGPRAIRVVAGAFNDLVANLRLLETKSQVLATADFDDPVLDEPLPGRLGASIQASISMLSGSIEERDQLQRRLAHQATHDALTGLQNRPAAIAAVEQALARGRRAGEPVSVLFVDLDGFKAINDTYGHDVGDEVLREVARRMLEVARDDDTVARLGGDEFLVVAEQAGDVEATTLARRIIDAVGEPIEAGGRNLGLAASVGIALSLDGSGDPLEFLVRADLALYRAKARGRACVELYDESLQRELLRRSEIERALADTLRRDGDELELHYQPVVGAIDGAVRAAEALIRWQRPGEGRVFPDEFIPVAETSDLIVDLDVWVLGTAARHAVSWPDHGPVSSSTAVSVNVSGRHLLSERLYDHVRETLEATGLAPERLILEITETVLLTDIPTAAGQLDALRRLGVRVAVDDFGTGYTSLAALQGLPIDTIKVDRSFVHGVTETRQRSLVALVAQLGHQLGVTVVAEGVETAEQLSALQSLGCEQVQGYLVCRPVPEPQLHTLVAAVPEAS